MREGLRGFGVAGILTISVILLAGSAAIVGLPYAAIFAATGRLFVLMVAHAAFDLAARAIIYSRLEASIAELVFK